jgi:hypothetical protein
MQEIVEIDGRKERKVRTKDGFTRVYAVNFCLPSPSLTPTLLIGRQILGFKALLLSDCEEMVSYAAEGPRLMNRKPTATHFSANSLPLSTTLC